MRNLAHPVVPDVDRAIKPSPYRDLGAGNADTANVELEFVAMSVVAQGVVIGNLPGSLGAQHGAQVESVGYRPEGGFRLTRLDPETFSILGDEHPVEIVRGPQRVGDAVMVQFCHQSVLK